jgi:hypothetical protein
VFAEGELGSFQRNILRFVYRDAYAANTSAVEEGAKLPAFGKPLLTALVLYVLCAKMRAFASVVDAPNLSNADRSLIGNGLNLLRDRVAHGATAVAPLVFIRIIVLESARALTLFQEGHLPVSGTRSYRALGSEPVHQVATDPTLSTWGIREMAAALGLMGLGEESGLWNVSNGDTGAANDGVLRVASSGTGSVTRVFFTANTSVALRLETNGLVNDDDGDAVVIHSTSPIAPMPRSPRRAPGRTGSLKARHVDMNMLLHDAVTMHDLRDCFRVEAAL